MKKVIIAILAIPLLAVVCLLLIQVIPYGRGHENPPVVREPNWDSPRTRELAVRACYDCHSNETVWPWYSNIAPVSWLVQHDVEEGRSVINFSDWRNFKELREMGEVIAEGEMPPLQYFPTHPEARLDAEEKQFLITGIEATIRNTP